VGVIMALFAPYKKHPRAWMVCEPMGYRQNETPCLFDEETGMRRGDPPRCIRHGALLFSDTTLNGLTREQAKRKLSDD
jgi:hypothetical protein